MLSRFLIGKVCHVINAFLQKGFILAAVSHVEEESLLGNDLIDVFLLALEVNHGMLLLRRVKALV